MLILGHRGASGEAPENTMLAFELARSQGADGIELDVFLTRDDQVVVTHDENTSRLADLDMDVRKSTLPRLKKLDFGKGERIPTLKEVLDTFGKSFEMINIEIKSTGLLTDGIEKEVVNAIESVNPKSHIVVSSFNPLHVLRMKFLASQIERALLISPDNWYVPHKMWTKSLNLEYLNCDYRMVSENFLAWARAHGLKICLWTVNDEAAMEKCVAWPVDAVITNYPARMKKIT